jgi:hypothetical protein
MIRVCSILTINGASEVELEGDTDIFDKQLSYDHNRKRLASIGFWLTNWRYVNSRGRNYKNKVFIPWTSCLMIKTIKGEESAETNIKGNTDS